MTQKITITTLRGIPDHRHLKQKTPYVNPDAAAEGASVRRLFYFILTQRNNKTAELSSEISLPIHHQSQILIFEHRNSCYKMCTVGKTLIFLLV